MHTFILCVHVGVGLFMILTVLLQAGKGGGGLGFGNSSGSSQTVFGASGAGNFLTKLTTFCAVTFMVTSLTLAYLASNKASKSIVDDVPAATGETPAAGTTPAPAEGAAPAAPTPAK